MEKITRVIDLLIELWGKEIFEWLEIQAADTDSKIDDLLVAGLKKWLLP